MKTCAKCGITQAVTNFHKQKNGKDGLYYCCKTCRNNKRYRLKFNLSPSEWKDLLSQGCESCGDKLSRMVIDHCHQTGRVRGGLCNNCNLALGLLGEDPLRMHNLANYIIRKTLTD